MEPDRPRRAPKRPPEAQRARKAQINHFLNKNCVRSSHGARQAQESPKKAFQRPRGPGWPKSNIVPKKNSMYGAPMEPDRQRRGQEGPQEAQNATLSQPDPKSVTSLFNCIKKHV